MNPSLTKTTELAELDAKLSALLPARYQHCLSSVSTSSMGSASLKYGPDGKVLWDQIWTTFCDLALAGGPPHRGKLLEPVSEPEALADPERYHTVVAELSRAIGLAAELPTVPGYAPGWLGVRCESTASAAWLQLAVTAENVSVRRRDDVLHVPAGPAFRVEKEIKNVVVALAKSLHYWDGHLTERQQTLGIGDIWEPATPAEAATIEHRGAAARVCDELRSAGLSVNGERYAGWIGVDAPDETAATWLLRAVIVNRILARREGATLFVPIGAAMTADQAARLVNALTQAWSLNRATAAER
jgi:hypothetical protein